MNAPTIQAMIAINAARIREIELDITDARAEAAMWKSLNETAFKIAAYASVSQIARKLAKAVKLQRTMKVELEAIFTAQRIKVKASKLELACSISFLDYLLDSHNLTYAEDEALLDKYLLPLFPQKPDSRKQV